MLPYTGFRISCGLAGFSFFSAGLLFGRFFYKHLWPYKEKVFLKDRSIALLKEGFVVERGDAGVGKPCHRWVVQFFKVFFQKKYPG